VQDSTIVSSSDDQAAGMSVDSQLIPIMITAAGDLGLGIAYKTGPGATETSIGAGVSVTEVSISGNSLATIDQSTITLAQGNLAVSAFTGQAEDYSELDSILAEINLPLGEYNLYSLAIAGGLSSAFSASGEMAFGINGVGAGIGSSTNIATQAAISSDSSIQLSDNNASGGSLAITALENLNIYDDAGGASVSIAFSDGNVSVGIAVGVGSAVHTSTNSVIASLESSTVATSGDLNVRATSESEVKAIGFGVALNVSVATLVGVSVASSAAVAKIDSTDTISAYVSGGTTTAGNDATDSLSVVALDLSNYNTAVGSGSLAVSFGGDGGVSLASGASVSRIEPSNTISAYIGTPDSTSTTSPVPTTTVTASGPVLVEATNQQVLAAEAIAVASSVAIGLEGSGSFAGAGASSRIETANIITAGVLSGAALSSKLLESTGTAISIQANGNANINSTVGSAAAAFTISPVPIGGSLGVSISEITNNDRAAALLQSATITTSGGDVVVQAKGTNNQSSKSVATSLSDGLGAAGAGGNSNIYDYSEFTASVDSGAAIDTSTLSAGSSTSEYGSLSVLATSAETILAQVYGGSLDLGIGSVGVFYSNALRSGSTQANLVTAGSIRVGDLNVEATTDQTVTSEGMSVTIGILAGSGEVHNVSVDETVGVSLGGSTGSSVTPWSVSGNLTVDATSENNATAQTSGAGDGGAGVNVALLGAGGFKVVSNVLPTVQVSVSDVSLTVAGTSLMKAEAQSINEANTRSGSGSLVGANAAIAQTENNPTIELTTNNLQLTAASATIQVVNDLVYDMSTDSVYATLVGGSGASATNNSTPSQSLTLGAGTAINTTGSVVVSSINTMAGAGGGDSLKASGFMANVGGGALAGGFGGLSTSDMNSTSTITLEDGVSITANNYGNIQIGAQNSWDLLQLTHLSTGSAISGVGISSTVESELDTSIQIGDGVVLKALEGQVGIGTNISSLTSADSYAHTFGLAGAVKGIVDNEMTAKQSVIVGENTTIMAGEGIAITAGYNPLNQLGTQINAYAIVTSRVIGLLDIPKNTYDSDLSAVNTVSVGTGTNIISDRDVQIGSVQGISNAVAYSFASIDGGRGKAAVVTDGVVESNVVTLDGTIIAGQDHELAIDLQESGGSYTMSINGGSPQSVPNSVNGSLQTVEPVGNQAFVPFQVGLNSAYDPAQLLVGLDPTVQAVLSLSLSSTPVPAVSLDKLTAVGGRVLIEAGSLNGSGAVFAYAPEIVLTNNSAAYLLLGSMTIPQTYGMGQIDLTGGAAAPSTLSLNQSSSPPTVSVTSIAAGPVGNNAAGPAIGLLDEISNTAGSVSITNDHGAFAQEGTIVAATVTIDVPNASYIVNTPSDYFGTSGAIQEYWGNNVNLIPDGNFESPQWGNQGTSYTYNP
ncbi:MAG: beta strand repeat-containing protein, partial [Pirellula sp.]